MAGNPNTAAGLFHPIYPIYSPSKLGGEDCYKNKKKLYWHNSLQAGSLNNLPGFHLSSTSRLWQWTGRAR